MTTQKRKLLGKRNGLNIYSTLKIKSKLTVKKPINKVTNKTVIKKRKEAELRQKLLIRCGGLCENCRQKPDWRGLSKHEIIFRSHGGDPLAENNCLMLCGKCHNDKHGVVEK